MDGARHRVAGDVVTAADAARAALAAYEGGPAVAVVLRLDGPGAGRRLLVFETGEVRGSLGSASLDAQATSLARQALEARGRSGGGAEVVAVAEGGGEGGVGSGGDEASWGGGEGAGGDAQPGCARLYIEVHVAPEELVIVGAGHIAVPLARLGVMLGYRVTVLDDREEFATPARFPEEASVRRMDFADPFRDVPIGPRTHVLLVTRAHRYDFDCLKHLLTRDPLPRYIGMIGSRRRVRATFQALLEAGIPRERVARVSAPVGLDIGAETPEEIAVSIAAELVAVRRMGVGTTGASATGAGATAAEPSVRRAPISLSTKERVLDRLLPEVDHG